MLLHADLHFLNGRLGFTMADGTYYKYVILFIDSFSRMIVHWGFMKEKTAAEAKMQLQACICKCYSLNPGHGFGWIRCDQGGEFKSAFY